jgi:hypothetical protein
MSQTPEPDQSQIYPKVGDVLLEKELAEGDLNYSVLAFAAPLALLSGTVTAVWIEKLHSRCCTGHILCHSRNYPFVVATAISGVSLWMAVKLAQTRISTVVSFLNEPIAVKPIDVVFSMPSLFVGAAVFSKIFIHLSK